MAKRNAIESVVAERPSGKKPPDDIAASIEALRRLYTVTSGDDARFLRDVADDIAGLRGDAAKARETIRVLENRSPVGGDLRRAVLGFVEQVEAASRYWQWKREGSKGMHVPFHGDFASGDALPAIAGRLEWWAKRLREELSREGLPPS